MQLDKQTLTEVHRQLTAELTRAEEDRAHYLALSDASTGTEKVTLKRMSQRAGWSRQGLDIATVLVMDLIKQP
jgi:hypothetical protein